MFLNFLVIHKNISKLVSTIKMISKSFNGNSEKKYFFRYFLKLIIIITFNDARHGESSLKITFYLQFSLFFFYV